MRYMDLHKTDPIENSEPEDFFQSLAPAGYAPPRSMSLPGLEGLFFVVATTAALVGGMLAISLVTSRDLSIGGGGVGSLQTAPTASAPSQLQPASLVGEAQQTDQAASLQNTDQSQGVAVGAEALQAGKPIGEIRY